MYNILILSEFIEPFSELSELLKKQAYNVCHLSCRNVETSINDLKRSDFVLLHLGHDEVLNETNIKMIKEHSLCPLYVFSSGHTPEEVAQILKVGSEGHIDIPFHADVVCARIHAVFRYVHQIKKGIPSVLKYGNLVLYLDNREIYLNNKYISLTNVESKILQILLEHKETVVSKDKIIQFVWDEDQSATDNALGIHITRLRKKMSSDQDIEMIETIWGLGYRLNMKAFE